MPTPEETNEGFTMKVKVSELTGDALTWAAAFAEGLNPKVTTLSKGGKIVTYAGNNAMPFTAWAQAGPILEREKIELIPLWLNDSFEGYAASHRLSVKYDKEGEFVQGSDCKQYGQTPLIAAMRCFCHSKLGEFVDIPEDLI